MSKFYAVRVGVKPGIYTSWNEAQGQVIGYSKAEYKSFKSEQEAMEYMKVKSAKAKNENPTISCKKSKSKRIQNEKVKTKSHPKRSEMPRSALDKPYKREVVDLAQGGLDVYVVGGFSKEKERYSFGAVIIVDGEIVETLQRAGNNPNYIQSTNHVGEAFGTLHAMEWAIDRGFDKIKVYHEFEGVREWVSGEWEAKKPFSQDYLHHYEALAPYIDVEFEKVEPNKINLEYELAIQLADEATDYCLF